MNIVKRLQLRVMEVLQGEASRGGKIKLNCCFVVDDAEMRSDIKLREECAAGKLIRRDTMACEVTGTDCNV